ncbi:MAG: helix-turn-helix domain-containing protein [Clostridiaceae bacterium]|jgi:transcriptional regulator with XRE-family HTH domain|nr:helix-turn-helix domain-containing protein [Clostridiaceae bacterium]
MESLEIYAKIDSLRKHKGWTTNYLSKQAGVSHNTLYMWRTRQTMPTFEVVEALCDALQISLVQLFGDESAAGMTTEQKRVLEYWSTLNREQKDLIINMMVSLRGSVRQNPPRV